jgi:thioredoxin 1
MPTEVTSALHLRTLLSSHTYLIADFYATWCPPCKTIAPIFEQLSTSTASSPAANKIAFVKINVDEQREIAAEYGITAMPTFLVFKDSKVTETIRGANPPALKQVVQKAVADVGSQKEEAKPAPATKAPVQEKKDTSGLSMAERLGIKLG